MTRPRCRRCDAPLELVYDGESDRYEWQCVSPCSLQNDEQFKNLWAALPEAERQRLAWEA